MATVVTGAGGHVGACLVRRLLDEGRSVRAIDLDHGPGLEGLELDRRSGDIRDPAFMRSCIEPGDTVFHLASVISTSGDKGGLVPSVNIDGARNVAKAASEMQAKRLIHFSSVHAYDIDTHGAPVTEQTRPATANSRSAYNRSKWNGQTAVFEVARETGLEAVVVNPCGVIGPYDYKASRMGKFFRSYAKGRTLTPGPGGFNWVDVRDVVDGALRAEQSGTPGENYLLSGHWHTSLSLGQLAAKVRGLTPPTKAISWWFVDGLATLGPVLGLLGKKPPVTKEALEALRANPAVSHDKATQALGYRPRPTEDTIRAIFEWIDAEGILDKDRVWKAAQKAKKAG